VASHRFASIRELLQGVGVELVKTTGSTAALVPIWNEAVGPAIAKNATPTALYGDMLVVDAENAQWAQAIGAQHDAIVARLPASVGVRRLRVQVRSAPHPGPLPVGGEGGSR
jgi:predicted nucleic acid-binding Zn ribbon protein